MSDIERLLPLSPLSISACRVPSLQFDTFVGKGNKLVTSDIATNLMPFDLPADIKKMTGMLSSGLGIVPPIPTSLFSSITSATSSLTTSLTGIASGLSSAISGALGGDPTAVFKLVGGGNPLGALGGLTSLTSILGASPIPAIQGQLAALTEHLPTIAGVMATTSQLSSSLGLPAPPSLTSTFAPLVASYTGGGIAGAVSGISSQISSITSAASGNLSSFAPNLGSLTSGLTSSFNGATSMMNDMTSNISTSLSTYVHLSNATVISSMASTSGELHSFLGQIATPNFKSLLPPLPPIIPPLPVFPPFVMPVFT